MLSSIRMVGFRRWLGNAQKETPLLLEGLDSALFQWAAFINCYLSLDEY